MMSHRGIGSTATLVVATLMSDERSSRRPLITRPWTDEEECHCSGIDPAGEAATRDRCKAWANRNRRTKPERQAAGRNRFQRADATYWSGRVQSWIKVKCIAGLRCWSSATCRRRAVNLTVTVTGGGTGLNVQKAPDLSTRRLRNMQGW